MQLRLCSCLPLFFLLLPAASLEAAASDLYGTINRQRAGHGNCPALQNLPPLKPRAALERVARDLSQGGELVQRLKETGYRATRSRAFSINGEGVGAQGPAILARQAYCQPLQDAGMTEVGVYQDARQVWVVMAAPFAPSVALSAQAAGQRVLDLVNQARATPRTCGDRVFKAAPPLRWNATLAEASRLHAEDMARYNYFRHEGREGSTPAQRVERAGYRYLSTGENLASGTNMQAQDAVAGWLKSPGHCANLMSPGYTEMGAAFAVNPASDMGIYWAQAFGTPR
jgi:uncharacterized protein YkwD